MFNNHIPNKPYLPLPGQQQKQEKVEDMNQINLEINPRLNRQLNKLDPLTLDPQTATFEDIQIHAKTEQYLSKTTIQKRIRYLKYMENHEYPVDLKKADKTNFIRHIRYRLYYEKPPGTTDALRHEKLAFNMLRKAYGLPEIELKLPKKLSNKKMIIPFPNTVRQFWKHNYYKKPIHNKLFQYLFRTSFLLGMRPPSEIANLREQDIIFNQNNTAIITLHEDKEHNRQRTLALPPAIATDYRQKSLKNWMEHWRPRIINENCDAIFPKRNGDYWTPPNLGKYMRINGKQVWQPYHPYVSRHWSCVARLIEQKHTTNHWNTLAVKEWHGHDKIKNTEKYIKHARQYYQLERKNWIQRVLKAPYTKRCEENPLNRQTAKTPLCRVELLRENRMGEATTKHFNRRKTLRQIPILMDCRFNSSFFFSFIYESFQPGIDEGFFSISSPPYMNLCSSSILNSSFNSNSNSSYFFYYSDPYHRSLLLDYSVADQQKNNCSDVFCCCKNLFFSGPLFVDLSHLSSHNYSYSFSIHSNIIKIELFNYEKQCDEIGHTSHTQLDHQM